MNLKTYPVFLLTFLGCLVLGAYILESGESVLARENWILLTLFYCLALTAQILLFGEKFLSYSERLSRAGEKVFFHGQSIQLSSEKDQELGLLSQVLAKGIQNKIAFVQVTFVVICLTLIYIQILKVHFLMVLQLVIVGLIIPVAVLEQFLFPLAFQASIVLLHFFLNTQLPLFFYGIYASMLLALAITYKWVLYELNVTSLSSNQLDHIRFNGIGQGVSQGLILGMIGLLMHWLVPQYSNQPSPPSPKTNSLFGFNLSNLNPAQVNQLVNLAKTASEKMPNFGKVTEESISPKTVEALTKEASAGAEKWSADNANRESNGATPSQSNANPPATEAKTSQSPPLGKSFAGELGEDLKNGSVNNKTGLSEEKALQNLTHLVNSLSKSGTGLANANISQSLSNHTPGGVVPESSARNLTGSGHPSIDGTEKNLGDTASGHGASNRSIFAGSFSGASRNSLEGASSGNTVGKITDLMGSLNGGSGNFTGGLSFGNSGGNHSSLGGLSGGGSGHSSGGLSSGNAAGNVSGLSGSSGGSSSNFSGGSTSGNSAGNLSSFGDSSNGRSGNLSAGPTSGNPIGNLSSGGNSAASSENPTGNLNNFGPGSTQNGSLPQSLNSLAGGSNNAPNGNSGSASAGSLPNSITNEMLATVKKFSADASSSNVAKANQQSTQEKLNSVKGPAGAASNPLPNPEKPSSETQSSSTPPNQNQKSGLPTDATAMPSNQPNSEPPKGQKKSAIVATPSAPQKTHETPKPQPSLEEGEEKREEEKKEKEKKEKKPFEWPKMPDLKPLVIILAAALVYYFITSLYRKVNLKSNPKRKMTRQERNAMEEMLHHLDQQKLSVREEIIKKYHLFVDFMKLTDHPKRDFVSALNYYEELEPKYPQLKPEMEYMTYAFCDVLYGDKDLQNSELVEYRKSVARLFHKLG